MYYLIVDTDEEFTILRHKDFDTIRGLKTFQSNAKILQEIE